MIGRETYLYHIGLRLISSPSAVTASTIRLLCGVGIIKGKGNLVIRGGSYEQLKSREMQIQIIDCE